MICTCCRPDPVVAEQGLSCWQCGCPITTPKDAHTLAFGSTGTGDYEIQGRIGMWIRSVRAAAEGRLCSALEAK